MTAARSLSQWSLLPGGGDARVGMRITLANVVANDSRSEGAPVGRHGLPIMVEWSDDGSYADRIVAAAHAGAGSSAR